MNLKQIKFDLDNNVIVSRATFVRAIEYAIELESRQPDIEAIAWAYKTLLNMGYGGTANQDTALMLDRLNLMLLEAT